MSFHLSPATSTCVSLKCVGFSCSQNLFGPQLSFIISTVDPTHFSVRLQRQQIEQAGLNDSQWRDSSTFYTSKTIGNPDIQHRGSNSVWNTQQPRRLKKEICHRGLLVSLIEMVVVALSLGWFKVKVNRCVITCIDQSKWDALVESQHTAQISSPCTKAFALLRDKTCQDHYFAPNKSSP